ncbi:potassium channel family protein [Actinomycetospora flava]|uniref:Potassium channel family protein n=1 Tax=Actinomycetospora flava TaxID=3129232 RepID=A0ABU8MG47_9PSEU
MWFWPKGDRLTPRRAVQMIVLATVSVVLVAGPAVWLTDRRDFPTLGLAWWWALQTATTIGYGDIVPHTVLGRVVGAVLMVESTAFIAIVTAGITSALVNRARREDLADGLPTADGDLDTRLDELDERLARIERALRRLEEGSRSDRAPPE